MEIFTFHLISVSLGIDDDLLSFLSNISSFHNSSSVQRNFIFTHPLMMLTHHLREMKKSEIQNIYICCQFSFDAVFSCSRTIILMQFDPSYDASESDWALCCRVLQRCKFLLRFIPRILQVKDSYHDIYNKVVPFSSFLICTIA